GIYVSPTLQASGYPAILRLQAKREESGLTRAEEAQLARMEASLETKLDHFRRMLDGGLRERMVTGSDSGCGDLAFGHLDYDLHFSTNRGLPPHETLQAATRIAADAIGRGDELGTLAPGKLA